MNSTQIEARDLLAGDFVVIGTTAKKIISISPDSGEYVEAYLADGTSLLFNGFDKVAVLDDTEAEHGPVGGGRAEHQF